ncbi:hypothetical protein pb186bvf_004328 [Paramecium bursaria]
MMIQNNYQQLAKEIYKKRKELLLQTIDPDQLRKIEDLDGFLITEKLIEQMDKHDQQRQLFTLDLIIQGIKCWQGYMLDDRGRQLFQQKDQDMKYQQEIVGNIFMLEKYFQQEVNLQQFKDKNLIDIILSNLKRNIETIAEALQLDKVEKQDIDQYFKEVQFYTFDGFLENQIYGLSSYDGKRVYFSKLVLFKKNNEKYLEGLVVNHLHQYLIKNKDPLYQQYTFPLSAYFLKLSPQDYYLLEEYRTKAWYFSPFSFLVMPYAYYFSQFM